MDGAAGPCSAAFVSMLWGGYGVKDSVGERRDLSSLHYAHPESFLCEACLFSDHVCDSFWY